MIKVDPKRCPQDHRCPAIRVCPFDALIQNGHGLPEVDAEKCTLCLTCISYCPLGAIVDT